MMPIPLIYKEKESNGDTIYECINNGKTKVVLLQKEPGIVSIVF